MGFPKTAPPSTHVPLVHSQQSGEFSAPSDCLRLETAKSRTRSVLAVPPGFDGLLRSAHCRFFAPCSRSWGSPRFRLEPALAAVTTTRPPARLPEGKLTSGRAPSRRRFRSPKSSSATPREQLARWDRFRLVSACNPSPEGDFPHALPKPPRTRGCFHLASAPAPPPEGSFPSASPKHPQPGWTASSSTPLPLDHPKATSKRLRRSIHSPWTASSSLPRTLHHPKAVSRTLSRRLHSPVDRFLFASAASPPPEGDFLIAFTKAPQPGGALPPRLRELSTARRRLPERIDEDSTIRGPLPSCIRELSAARRQLPARFHTKSTARWTPPTGFTPRPRPEGRFQAAPPDV